MSSKAPSIDAWLQEAKASEGSSGVGMYLIHNGVVREDPRQKVREGINDGRSVKGMRVVSDHDKAALFEKETLSMPGITYARVWLNEGILKVGDDIMLVLIGGDIRSHVIEALKNIVEKLKSECVSEEEIFEDNVVAGDSL